MPEKNLTQKELSQLSGITQADLSKIENGNANPSLNTLLKLAKGLGKKVTNISCLILSVIICSLLYY